MKINYFMLVYENKYLFLILYNDDTPAICILASTIIIRDCTIAIPCCIARDYLIFHINFQFHYLFIFNCLQPGDWFRIGSSVHNSIIHCCYWRRWTSRHFIGYSHESYLWKFEVFNRRYWHFKLHKVTEQSMDVKRSVDELLDVFRSQHCCFISISTCCEHLHLTTQ